MQSSPAARHFLSVLGPDTRYCIRRYQAVTCEPVVASHFLFLHDHNKGDKQRRFKLTVIETLIYIQYLVYCLPSSVLGPTNKCLEKIPS
jgi:hypothetical protein